MGGFYSWTEMSMSVGGGNTNENRKGGGRGKYRERRQKDIAQGRTMEDRRQKWDQIEAWINRA